MKNNAHNKLTSYIIEAEKVANNAKIAYKERVEAIAFLATVNRNWRNERYELKKFQS